MASPKCLVPDRKSTESNRSLSDETNTDDASGLRRQGFRAAGHIDLLQSQIVFVLSVVDTDAS